ncbi:MAG: metallophosphoesterase [Clostridia bacterium]|nr:metallophosphoesterase [Clostridia bacterium]
MSLPELLERKLYVPGLSREYRFLHLTDAHLVLYDETETRERAEYAAPRIPMFAKDGVPSAERFQAALDWADANRESLDGVLLTGDIIDFPSGPNLAYLEKALAGLELPWVYTLGNHDWAYFNDYHTPHAKIANRPLFSRWCGGNTYIQKVRFGEIAVIGLDDTMDMYEDGVAETLAESMAGEENVILIQHVPLYVDTLHEDTVARWKRDLNIGGEGGICRNGNWKKVLELVLAADSPVRAVIAGHLHMNHLDYIGGKVPQILTAAAAYGWGTVVTLTGSGCRADA